MKKLFLNLIVRIAYLFMIVLSVSTIGCVSTLVLERCDDWAYQGNESVDSTNYIGITEEQCKHKCNCLLKGSRSNMNCEEGEHLECLVRCMRLWDMTCKSWTEEKIAVESITQEPVK